MELESFLSPDVSIIPWRQVLGSILLSFFFCVLIAKTYEHTHKGVSYSKAFFQALILGGLVSCMVIMAIGNSVVVGLGLMGTLAMIRFRTTMKDPRDMIFIFACLGSGIACGVGAYFVALVGAVAFCAAALFLMKSPFAADSNWEALLRMQISKNTAAGNTVNDVLKKSCNRYVLVSFRDAAQGKSVDLSYHLNFSKSVDNFSLLEELNRLDGVTYVDLIPRETVSEV